MVQLPQPGDDWRVNTFISNPSHGAELSTQ
jgi:hypothetical protein